MSTRRPEYPNSQDSRGSSPSALDGLPRIVGNVLYVQARLPLVSVGKEFLARNNNVSRHHLSSALRTTPTTHVPRIKLRIRLCIPRGEIPAEAYRFTTLPANSSKCAALYGNYFTRIDVRFLFFLLYFLQFILIKRKHRILFGYGNDST